MDFRSVSWKFFVAIPFLPLYNLPSVETRATIESWMQTAQNCNVISWDRVQVRN